MLNEKDSKALDRVAKYFYPIALIVTPLLNLGFFEWVNPHMERLFVFVQANYPLGYPYFIGLALLGIGWAAFQVKTRWRWWYGAAELFIAYISGIAWFTSSALMGLKELLAGAAVVYLVVRGLDNMREADKAKAALTLLKPVEAPL